MSTTLLRVGLLGAAVVIMIRAYCFTTFSFSPIFRPTFIYFVPVMAISCAIAIARENRLRSSLSPDWRRSFWTGSLTCVLIAFCSLVFRYLYYTAFVAQPREYYMQNLYGYKSPVAKYINGMEIEMINFFRQIPALAVLTELAVLLPFIALMSGVIAWAGVSSSRFWVD